MPLTRLITLLALTLLLGACGVDDSDLVDDSDPELLDDGGPAVETECDEETLGADELTIVTSAYEVVGGELGEPCFGDEDLDLLAAWDQVAAITPAGQLTDLALFVAFESAETGEETTLAFVNVIDDEGEQFQMSVNTAAAAEGPEDALLTLAHEFSHIFTAVPSQLDRSVEAIEGCQTYYNGEGCYAEDSIMFQWIELFWGDGLIDQVDPDADATAADGEERCDDDEGFLGPYAASTPEEDFAESFSAFVFDVPATTDGQQERFDWIADQPGLEAFRERADAAGLTPLANTYPDCGLDPEVS